MSHHDGTAVPYDHVQLQWHNVDHFEEGATLPTAMQLNTITATMAVLHRFNNIFKSLLILLPPLFQFLTYTTRIDPSSAK